MRLPGIKVAKVRRQTVRTADGWTIEREEIQGKQYVSLKIVRPDGFLRLKLVMTKDEWKELKK